MKNSLLLLSFIFLFVCNSCTDLDNNLKVADLEDVIAKDSEIYQLLELTSKALPGKRFRWMPSAVSVHCSRRSTRPFLSPSGWS